MTGNIKSLDSRLVIFRLIALAVSPLAASHLVPFDKPAGTCLVQCIKSSLEAHLNCQHRRSARCHLAIDEIELCNRTV